MTAPNPILKLEAIHRRFTSGGRWVDALGGVSITLARGETLGIIGESGSGKSTLGRIAVGLDAPTSGRVHIGGSALDELPAVLRRDRFRQCQMIFQDPYSSLNPRLTVGRQIGEGLYLTGVVGWRDVDDQVADLLQKVGLSPDHARRYPHEFSGGQRQRIAIARALAPSPSIVVADEPVSALDVTIQAQILDLLAELKRENQLSYLFISHDMAVVARLCDRVAVMHRGRIVEYGPTAAVITDARHPYTRSLLDAVPRFGRRRTGRRAVPALLPPPGGNVFVEVTPGHGVLDISDRSGTPPLQGEPRP